MTVTRGMVTEIRIVVDPERDRDRRDRSSSRES